MMGILLGFEAAGIPVYLFIALRTGAWQLLAIVGLSVMLILSSLAGMWLARRGYLTQGVWLILGVTILSALLIAILISGLGLVLGLLIAMVLPQVAIQALPANQIRWGIVASFASAAAILLVDVFTLQA